MRNGVLCEKMQKRERCGEEKTLTWGQRSRDRDTWWKVFCVGRYLGELTRSQILRSCVPLFLKDKKTNGTCQQSGILLILFWKPGCSAPLPNLPNESRYPMRIGRLDSGSIAACRSLIRHTTINIIGEDLSTESWLGIICLGGGEAYWATKGVVERKVNGGLSIRWDCDSQLERGLLKKPLPIHFDSS